MLETPNITRAQIAGLRTYLPKERLFTVYALQINLNVWTHLVIHLVKASKQRWCSRSRPLCIRTVGTSNLAEIWAPCLVDFMYIKWDC